MNLLKYLTTLSLATTFLLITICLSGQSTDYKFKETRDANGDIYRYLTNDPLNTRIYTLNNGLKIYISPNNVDSRIQAIIGVRAGSALEPVESTGLAHYLEHMLFKGSSRIGTVNWKAEQPLLKQVSDLFEKHRLSDNEIEKKVIYAQIDSLSSIAARYAAPNEFSKLASAMGAKGVNAATSYDFTYFRENIPSNELELWAKLESERMGEIALRLFHTELEAVYEEFNRAQDNDNRQIFYAMLNGLFKTHPYKRPVIGNPIDLKNPSMINIHKFFDTYYVPNNMFIVLSGRIDAENAVPVLKHYFANYKKSRLPNVELPKEVTVNQPVVNELFSKEEERVVLAYRFHGRNSNDYKYAFIINQLLSNSGHAGLMDIDLNQSGKVHSANSELLFLKDYGIQYFSGTPKNDQSLEEVQTLIEKEIEKIKNGEFEDWLLEAIVNNVKLKRISGFESNISRAVSIMNTEVYGIPYKEFISFPYELAKITKKDIVDFARVHYDKNYTIVYKRKGEKKLYQVEKPEITPLELNNQNQSDFAGHYLAIKPESLTPEFIDYKNELPKNNLKNGMNFYYQKESNGLFSLRYIIPVGRNHDKLLPFAIDYFRELGTSEYSPDSLKKEFFRYGITFNISAGFDKSYVNISGLDEYFNKTLELTEHLFANAKIDTTVYNKQIEKEERNRELKKDNKRAIGIYAQQYLLFGAHNPLTNIPSIEELKAEKPVNMLNKIYDLFQYNHTIFYSGNHNKDEVVKAITSLHKLPGAFAKIPPKKEYNYLQINGPKVFFLDYDMVQAQVNIIVPDKVSYSPDILAFREIYNKYYGVGIGSVIFQEIRESRALAYSSGSYYKMDITSNYNNVIVGYAGTQANKLPEATYTLKNLMENMKYDSAKFEIAQNLLIKSLESERIPRKYYFGRYTGLLEKGIDYDVRRTEYEDLKKIAPADFKNFFSEHINNPDKQYFILGRKQGIDFDALKHFGEVREITFKDIFGY